MGAHGGPNMVEDGMVFGYDTGNSKSYAGEPTVNFADTDAKRSWGTHGGATSTTEDAPEKGPGWKKLIITDINGNNYRLAKFPYLTQADGTTRTYSVEYDLGNLTGYFLFVDGTSGYDQTSVSGRGRYSATIGPVSGAKSISIFLGRSGTSNNINHVIYYRDYQVEEKSHATQFTAGTRSVTEGLIDFKDSTTLDLSNVSFDSDAQMTFDDTNDYIQLASDARGTVFDTQTFTIEAVIYPTVDPDTNEAIIWSNDFTSHSNPLYAQHLRLGGASGNSNELGFYWNNGSTFKGMTINNVIPTLNVHYHIIATYQSGYQAVYVNGELLDSMTEVGTITYYNQEVWISRANFGGYFGGDIPLLKFYNKALTAEEVQNNFNGIRNRFGI